MFYKLKKNRKKNFFQFNYAIFGFPVSHSLSPILMKFFCNIFNNKKGNYFRINFNTLRINFFELFELNYKNNNKEKDVDLRIHFANFTTPFKIKQEFIKNNIKSYFDNYNTFSIYSDKKINTDYLGIYFSLKDKIKTKQNIDYSIIIGKGNTAFSAIKALNIFKIKNLSIFYRSENKNRFSIFENVFKNINFGFYDINNIRNYFNNINKNILNFSKKEGKIIIINTSDDDIIKNYNLEEELRNIIKSGFFIYVLDLNYVKKPLSKWDKFFEEKFYYISPYEVFYYQGVFSFTFFINSFIRSNESELRTENNDKLLDKNFINYLLKNKNKFIKNLSKYITKNYKYNVSFIGFSYSGKSSVLKSLEGNFYNSDFINKFYDLDEMIEKNSNKSISEIFKNKGEKYFRNLEYTFLKRILMIKKQLSLFDNNEINKQDNKLNYNLKSKNNKENDMINKNSIRKLNENLNKKLNIVSLGGGVLENKKSYNFIRKNFYNIFFFVNDFEIIYNRYLKSKIKNRPIFENDYYKIKDVYLNRFNKYIITSNLIVNSSLNLLELTNIIEKELNNLYNFLNGIH